MSKFLIAAFAFVAVAAVGTTSHAQFRDAGSKIRGDAYEGTSDALRSYRTYYAAPVYVRSAPVAAPQPVVAATPAAPAQPPANATAAVNNAPSGTRAMSVEPQAVAPTMTYRAVAPRRTSSRIPWMYRADHKVLGHFNP